MDIILFSIVGIAVYFISDRLLILIEQKRGKPFVNRSIIYFLIFAVLILGSFELLKIILGGGINPAL